MAGVWLCCRSDKAIGPWCHPWLCQCGRPRLAAGDDGDRSLRKPAAAAGHCNHKGVECCRRDREDRKKQDPKRQIILHLLTKPPEAHSRPWLPDEFGYLDARFLSAGGHYFIATSDDNAALLIDDTARRFCDQQFSLDSTQTGLSLPKEIVCKRCVATPKLTR